MAKFKRTELGLLPADWEVSPCSDLSERIMVGIVIRPAQYYVQQGIPAFRSANIREDGIDDTDLVFISDRSNALLAKSQVRAGDVLTVRTGYPGTSAVVPPSFAGCNCIDILISRPRVGVSPQYLAAWINSPFGKTQVLRNQGGLAQQHFNVGDLRNLLVAVPPLPEQKTIAAALGDVDALLRALDRLIAKKRDLKQAAMQQLLTGQTRLPGYSGIWEISTVGMEFEIQLGKMLDTERNLGIQKPYLGNKAVQWNRIDLDDLKTMSMSDTDLERYRLRKGDLLVCEGGEIGRAAIWDAPLAECYYQKALHRLRPIKGFSTRLMLALLRYWIDHGLLKDYVSQTSIAHLTREKFAEVPLPIPTLAEQAAIATILDDMDTELIALEQRRDKTRLLKQGMMQELLTGRMRLV